MENKKINIENVKLTEQELENVNGGYYFGEKAITTNSLHVSSGDTPKYHEGQTVYIKYEVFEGNVNWTGKFKSKKVECTCKCVVTGVSETKNCGLAYKEYGYDVRVVGGCHSFGGYAITAGLVGKVYTGVYESCLYE